MLSFIKAYIFYLSNILLFIVQIKKNLAFQKIHAFDPYKQQEFSEKGDSVQLHKEDPGHGEKMEEQRQ